MIIRIYSIGKVKTPFIVEGEREYLKRISKASLRMEIVEIDAEKNRDGSIDTIQVREAARLLERIPNDSFFIALDENGKQMPSEAFAAFLQGRMNGGCKVLNFAIGGAFGWHADVLKRADLVLSLSELTFPFQLTRLILIEQLYRAQSIMQGLPYHKA